MKKTLIIPLLLTAFLLMTCAFSEEAEDEFVYKMTDENGRYITSRLGKMYPGDEYITSDNRLYEIVSADDKTRTAIARDMGNEPALSVEAASALGGKEKDRKLICMYSTHSDESYIPGDGESSLMKNAGIYDVGNALKKNLEKLGIETVYSEETFHPHDAGAYKRSRNVAAELMKKSPDALIDIHRDGIDRDEYETTVEGKEASMVRLFVGKNNANSSENRAFAKKLKSVADKEYPGLIKDIYIGKGNYNQDLYPQAILLEFGTHEIDKSLAIDSTEYMADVISQSLYPTSANKEQAATEKDAEKKGVSTGVKWLIGLSVAGAILFALVSTGTLKGAGKKLTGGFREMTGGMFSGKKGGKK
ncbi:MAG: stage II sporulation protein P [Clostridia bacterium]|nr:stage II sporulation protein P [Clostridia bacterium]